MVCTRCNKNVAECECSDIDERLASIGTMEHVAAKFCKKCDKHYARCRCAQPEHEIRGGNKSDQRGTSAREK